MNAGALMPHAGNTSHPGWQTLLEGSADGEAAVVEVAYELWMNGSTELSHFSVSGSDEDSLHSLHQNVVEQGVLCS